MNTQTQEALKMAIEALEEIHVGNMTPMAEINWNKAIQACKEALAQPQPKLFLDLSNSNGNHPVQQEPVACSGKYGCKCNKHYTHPAREWQGLSDDEIRSLDLDNDVISVIFQTEKLLKEKNA